MNYLLRHIIVVFGIFISEYCAAQYVEWLPVTKYDQSNGLSSYNIHTILKDKKGYLWVGTQFGLSRFDGRQFTNYSKSSPAPFRLCGVDIRQLVEDTANASLWVFPAEYGFNKIDLQSMTVAYSGAIPYDGLEEFGLTAAMIHNRLWLGAIGLRIFNISSGKFESSSRLPAPAKQLHDLELRYLFTDKHKNAWCFYKGYGLVIYNGSDKQIIRVIELDKFNDYLHSGIINFNGCIPLADGHILAATSQGLRLISYDPEYNITINNKPCKFLPELNKAPIEAIGRTKSNDLLIATHDQLYRTNLSLTSYSILKEATPDLEGDWLSSVQYIYCDEQNNIWLGCQKGLAFINGKKNPFQSYYFDIASNKKLNHVRSICAPDDGKILAGLRNGIAQVDRNSKTFAITDEGHLYHHIFQDKNNRIIVARNDGLFVFQNGQTRPVNSVYPEFNAFSKNPVNSHIFVGDSMLVMGTENDKGILLWNYKKHTVYQINNSTRVALASNVVNNIFLDKSERLWVLSDHVISILSKDFTRVKQLILYENKKSKREINLLFDMCETEHNFWITAYGTGVIQLDTTFNIQAIYNHASGLSDNGVYQVFPSRDKLIVTSDNGLSVIDRSTHTIKQYYEEDGLHSNSFEEVAGLMKEQLIYAGGSKGFTIIDPAKFYRNNIPPRLYINRVSVECADKRRNLDTFYQELKTLNIPNDVLQTTIYFSAINDNNPGHASFAYRIKKENSNWIDAGARDYITLIGLPPGTYQIEVKAANENKVWSKVQSIELVLEPKWFQSSWFKVLMVLVAIGIIFAVYKIRVDQLLKQQEIRKEVASDLHDDIGSSLNGVKIFAQLALGDPSKKEYMLKVKENLELASTGIRDIIWVLDDNRDSIEDFFLRLDKFVTRQAESLGITVHFNCSTELLHKALSKQVKRNLFLVAKEAINNSLKYAAGKNIYVEFRLQARKLELIIKDDGIGFNVDQVPDGGYGLSNMNVRARQIKYNFEITSGSSGTYIRLKEK